MKIPLVVAILSACLVSAAWAQQSQSPMTQEEVLKVLKKFKKDQMKAAAIVGERGVAFDMTPEFQKKLQKAGADRPFFEAVFGAGPMGRSFNTPLGQRLQVSAAEKLAFMQIQSELDPNTQLNMVDSFEKNFPSSPLMSYVYSQAARVYQQKGDYDKVVDFNARALKLEPNNVFSLVMMALVLPQPKMLQGSPADVDKKLATAETYANRALQLVDQIPAEFLEKDPQLQKLKPSVSSDAHAALGMVNLHRDNFAKAAEEFKAAIASSVNPNPVNYYRLGEAYENGGKIDLAIEAFKNASDLGEGTAIKDFADKKLAELETRK